MIPVSGLRIHNSILLYLMRYLPFVSILLLVTSCGSAYKQLQRTNAPTDCVKAFRPTFTRGLYHAQINVTGKHLSGLLLIKNMPDGSTRMVFTNEAGLSFFDFEWTGTAFNVRRIIRQMDRKALIKTLRKDFELILMQHLDAKDPYTLQGEEVYYRVFPNGKDHYYYLTDAACSTLIRMERGSRKKKVMEAVMMSSNRDIPDSIGIKHYNFNFEIGLKRLYDIER